MARREAGQLRDGVAVPASTLGSRAGRVVYEALNQPGPTFVYHAEEPGGRAAVNRALDDAGFQVAAVRAEGDGVLASEPIIDIAGVRKSFGRTTALDGLTMQV